MLKHKAYRYIGYLTNIYQQKFTSNKAKMKINQLGYHRWREKVNTLLWKKDQVEFLIKNILNSRVKIHNFIKDT